MTLLAKLLGEVGAKTITRVDPGELVTKLSDAEPPLVIDVRGPEEFTGLLGHIDGARNIPLDQIPAQAAVLIEAKRPLVFVCHTDRRSTAAAEHLKRVGASEVAVLSGGMVAWRSRPAR